jgi:hypothetical protein
VRNSTQQPRIQANSTCNQPWLLQLINLKDIRTIPQTNGRPRPILTNSYMITVDTILEPDITTFGRAGIPPSKESCPQTALQEPFAPKQLGTGSRTEEAISLPLPPSRMYLVHDQIGPTSCTPTTRKTCGPLPLPQARS